MGTFGTIFDVGHASGPIPAGLLIGFFGQSADYRMPFAVVAAILVAAAILFRMGVSAECRNSATEEGVVAK